MKLNILTDKTPQGTGARIGEANPNNLTVPVKASCHRMRQDTCPCISPPNGIIFVFGSNQGGRHGAGAALCAKQSYGAIYGQGEGLQGHSYAIPTKDANLNTLPLFEIEKGVERFLIFARENPNTQFVLTAIGTGLAGYEPKSIAPMFEYASANVVMPEKFQPILLHLHAPSGWSEADMDAMDKAAERGEIDRW